MGTKIAKPLHIFKSGKHTASSGHALEFNDSTVKQIASNYDPSVYKAPIVVGHPKTDDPAYGWVNSLGFEDGGLFAEPAQVDPAFADMVNAGRFKNISVALFSPDAPNNPKIGEYYLRHVGFLGATAPAVKGLKHAEFADDGTGVVTLEFSAVDPADYATHLRALRDWILAKFGRKDADLAVPSQVIDCAIDCAADDCSNDGGASDAMASADFSAKNDEDTVMSKELDVREAALKAGEERLAARLAEIQKVEREVIKKNCTEFADQLAIASRIRPTEKASLIEAMVAISSLSPIEFSDAGESVFKSPLDVIREALLSKPIAVGLERTPKDKLPTATDVEFTAPAGMTVSAEGLSELADIEAYSKEHKCDFRKAAQIYYKVHK